MQCLPQEIDACVRILTQFCQFGKVLSEFYRHEIFTARPRLKYQIFVMPRITIITTSDLMFISLICNIQMTRRRKYEELEASICIIRHILYGKKHPAFAYYHTVYVILLLRIITHIR